MMKIHPNIVAFRCISRKDGKTTWKLTAGTPKMADECRCFFFFQAIGFFRFQGVNCLHDLCHNICHVLHPWSPAVGDIVAIVRHHVGSIPDFPSDALAQQVECCRWWLNHPSGINMIVKLDHFPSSVGETQKSLKAPPRWWINSWESDCYQLSMFYRYMWNLAHSQ